MRGGTVQINWHDGQPVLTLDFHPQSGLLATGGNDHDIKLWATTPGDSQRKLPSASYQNSLSYHSAAVNVLRFSPSGDLLASGADGGELVIWKLHSTDDGQAWKVLKSLIFHRKDVLDLQWSAESTHLISGSVDNSCIIWDVNKGSVHQILDSHLHYVQGVSWDPLGQYVASLSSDRTCRVYVNKPQSKHKGHEKINYVCQYILTKSETENLDESKNPDESKPPSTKAHLFHDETLPSFFRRLSWSPDGSFLLVPAGIQKYSSASETVNTAYILSRRDLSRPAIQLPGASKPVVAVRFCPVLFCLRGSNSDGYFKLPYRVVFAVATLNSLYMFDTESLLPIAIYAGLHYAAITDIAWSRDAKYLALSSRDGYCTVLEFENDELGVPISTSEEKKISEGNGDHINIESEVVDSMEIDDIKSSKTEEASDVRQVLPMEINDVKSSESDRKTNEDVKSSESDGKTSEPGGTKQVLRDGKSVEGSDVRQVLPMEINDVKSSESDRKTNEDVKSSKSDGKTSETSGKKQVLRDGDGKAVEGSVVRQVLPTSTEALDDNKPKKKRITPVAIN